MCNVLTLLGWPDSTLVLTAFKGASFSQVNHVQGSFAVARSPKVEIGRLIPSIRSSRLVILLPRQDSRHGKHRLAGFAGGAADVTAACEKQGRRIGRAPALHASAHPQRARQLQDALTSVSRRASGIPRPPATPAPGVRGTPQEGVFPPRCRGRPATGAGSGASGHVGRDHPTAEGR